MCCAFCAWTMNYKFNMKQLFWCFRLDFDFVIFTIFLLTFISQSTLRNDVIRSIWNRMFNLLLRAHAFSTYMYNYVWGLLHMPTFLLLLQLTLLLLLFLFHCGRFIELNDVDDDDDVRPSNFEESTMEH